jgi:putative transposase
MCGKRITYYDQQNQLPEIKELREELQNIHSQVLQDTFSGLTRYVLRSYKIRCIGWIWHSRHSFDVPRTVRNPRFQGRERFDSFTYSQAGFSRTHDNRITLSKIGSVKIKLHRLVQGKVKTCTIKREGEHWYVCLSCEVEACPRLPYIDDVIGIDLGVSKLATLSTGDVIENPRHYRKAEKKLAAAQQALARKKRGSNRRKKAVKAVARLHRKTRNQRADYLHKHSRWLVDCYETIVFEDIAPANLSRRAKPKQDENGKYLPNGASAKSGVNKSILDAGWRQFITYCEYKAA